MAKLTEREFKVLDYVCVGMLARHKDYRAGQRLFNALHLIRPDLANEIRGSSFDPFYDDKKISDLMTWLNNDKK